MTGSPPPRPFDSPRPAGGPADTAVSRPVAGVATRPDEADDRAIPPEAARRLLASAASPAAAVLDRRGRVRHASSGLGTLLHGPPKDLRGRDARRLLADDDRRRASRLRRDIATALASGGWWTGVLALRTATDAVRWVEVLAIGLPATPGEPAGVATIGRDLTEARVAAEERAGLRQALDAAFAEHVRLQAQLGLAIAEQHRLAGDLVNAQDRLRLADEARSGLLRSVSHAIRTPVAALVGRADLLASDSHRVIADEARLGHLELIQRHAESLVDTVDRLLTEDDASQADGCVPVSPTGLLRDAVAEVQLDPRSRGVHFDLGFDRALPPAIVVDRTIVRHLVHDLLRNECLRRGGGMVAVRVEADLGADGGPAVAIRVTRPGRLLGEDERRGLEAVSPLEVLDRGPDEDEPDRLAAVARIARSLGGDLRADPDGRACLVLRIPAAPAPRASGSAPVRRTAPDPRRPLAGRRILVAEDFADHAVLLEELLRRAGADVVVVPNGAAAVRALAGTFEPTGPVTAPPPFDAVLLDMLMPVMDGYATARALRHRGLELPIIAVTATAMIGAEEACLAAGCTDYVPKPIDRDVLVDRLTRAMEPRRRAA